MPRSILTARSMVHAVLERDRPWMGLVAAVLPLAAAFAGIRGGLIVGAVMGLALGPFMPLDVATGEMRDPKNWVVRAAAFSGFGVVLGWWSDQFRAAAHDREKMALTDQLSGLLNRNALERHLADLGRQDDDGGLRSLVSYD